MLKSWRLALKTLNSYLPSLDCKNMDQNSWLNFLSCGFQAPALVSPLAAQGRTFLLRDILSWVCLPGEQGKKEEKSRMLSCKLAQTSGFLSCHGQCVGQEAACTPPQNFSPKTPPLSIYILLLRTTVAKDWLTFPTLRLSLVWWHFVE